MLDQLFTDRQTQAGPAFLTLVAAVSLGKLLEDMGAKCFGDSRALVADADPHAPMMQGAVQADLAAGGGELDGIGEEIGQYLLQARDIHLNLEWRAIEAHYFYIMLLSIGLVTEGAVIEQVV